MYDVGVNSVLQICVKGVCENMNPAPHIGVPVSYVSWFSYLKPIIKDYQANQDTAFKNVQSSGVTK